jgi:hypothetical protein
MVIFSLFFLIIFAMATPNVGNLYRFRYPFFMLLVSLGATSAIFLLRSRVRGVRAEPETALETDRDAAA